MAESGEAGAVEKNLFQLLEQSSGCQIETITADEVRQLLEPMANHRNPVEVIRFDGKLAVLKQFPDLRNGPPGADRFNNDFIVHQALQERLRGVVPEILFADLERQVLVLKYIQGLRALATEPAQLLGELSGLEEPAGLGMIVSAIKNFHDAGYVHGDLTSGNIGFERKGLDLKKVWIIDFEKSEKYQDGDSDEKVLQDLLKLATSQFENFRDVGLLVDPDEAASVWSSLVGKIYNNQDFGDLVLATLKQSFKIQMQGLE